MSDYKVPYTTIRDLQPHGNADKLEVATIYGFQVVVQKGRWKVGDSIIYVPIDSILPQSLEDTLFPAGSKIKLSNHRVRQIRIRGLASQGMVIDPGTITERVSLLPGGKAPIRWETIPLEMDLSGSLGITKYEPPFVGASQTQGARRDRNKKADHPLFHKYNGLDSIKWFPDLFKEGEAVVIQEKLHGTNARAGVLPYLANTWWKKLAARLGVAPPTERHYGSNNVQISGKTQGWIARLRQKLNIGKAGTYVGYYGQDLYGAAFEKCKAFEKIQPGEIIFGEIIGEGIQKGYDYGHKEPRFVLFDVKFRLEDGSFQWMTPIEVELYAELRGFEMVPWIYKGGYNKEEAYKMSSGPSVYHPGTKVREGIVIKAAAGYSVDGNKRALKWVSEEYLDDKSNTDNH